MKTRHPRRARRGFTIVEVMVAVLVMSVGILGLAGASAVVTRLLDRGDQQTAAAMTAQRRFERLRATRCPLASGSATVSGVTEKWVVIGQVGSPGSRMYDVVDSVSNKVRGKVKPAFANRSVVRCLP